MAIPLASLAPVLGCSVAFAGLDLMRKLLAGRVRALPLLFFLSAGALPAFLVWLAFAGGGAQSSAYWAPGLGSVLLNIGANLAFLEAVRLAPLSLTIPLLSFTPVFTTLVAVPLLGEKPVPLQVAGILVVVAGAFWLHRRRAAGPDGKPRGGLLRQRGSQLMLLVAFLWSLAMPLDKLALSRSSIPFHASVLNGGVALGVLILLLAQRRGRELAAARDHLPLLLLSAVVTLAALGLQLLAISLVWVGLVETLKRALGSLLALVLGRAVFGEPLSLEKLGAVLLLGAGVALILI